MGGFAITSSAPIRGDIAGLVADAIIKNVKNSLHINAAALGSTGKKTAQQMSGDIDIGIELDWTPENIKEVTDFIHDTYGDIEIVSSPGLKLISIGLPISPGQTAPQIVQVDFMFIPYLEYSKFIYHSPNYIKNESDFKGLYRTNLLAIIVSKTPIDTNKYPTEYFNIPGYEDVVMNFWKYTLNYSEGLKIVHKTYMGKKGKPVKNPITLKDDTIYLTTDVNEILHLILGKQATVATCNSFETLVKFICSPAFKNRSDEHLKEIFTDFFTDYRHTKDEEVLEVLKNFVRNELEKNNLDYSYI